MKASVERNLFDAEDEAQQQFRDEQNKYNVNLGAMANFTYVKGKNKISFKNLFNKFYEDNYYLQTGAKQENDNSDVLLNSSVLNLRTFYTGILEGNHQIGNRGIKAYWNAGYSLNTRKQPDLRTSAYLKDIGSNDAYEWDDDDSRRFFSNLQDHGFSGSASLSIPFNAFDEKTNLKSGRIRINEVP